MPNLTTSANVDTLMGSADFAAMRTSLGLVIGTNVQAFDADLSLWAAITPGAGVGTMLATFSSANILAACTDETGTGALVFGTGPTLASPTVTGTLGAAAITGTSLTVTSLTTKPDILQAPNTVTLTSAGTDTFTGTAGVTITSYVTGTHYTFVANNANTGAASINIDGLGAKTIVKVQGGITTTLADNDILSGQACVLIYDGTNMQLCSGLGNASAGGSGANPTASVGLTPTNGVATSFIRSDGAPSLSQAIVPTWTGAHIFNKSGAASTAAVLVNGVPFAGTGTTSFPLLYIADANATASTVLNTAGTYLGVNGDGTQDLMNLLKDGVSQFKIASNGDTISIGTFAATTIQAGASSAFQWNGLSKLISSNNGEMSICNASFGLATRLCFGNATNNAPGIGVDAVNSLKIETTTGTNTFNDASTANSGTVANRYILGIATPTLTSTGTSVTDTVASTLYIGGEPIASTNTTIGTAYALNVAGGKSLFGGQIVTGIQALSGAGAINVTQTATAYTSTGGSQALTLADGTNGQIKIIAHTVDGGSGILTPTTKTGYTTITFTNAGETAMLQFHTTVGWLILSLRGAVAA